MKKIGIVASRPELGNDRRAMPYLNNFDFEALISRLIERFIEEKWKIALRLNSQFTPLIATITESHAFENINETLEIYLDYEEVGRAERLVKSPENCFIEYSNGGEQGNNGFKFDIGIENIPDPQTLDVILYLGGGVVSRNTGKSHNEYDKRKEVYRSFKNEIQFMQKLEYLDVIPLVIGATGGYSYYSWNPGSAPEDIHRLASNFNEESLSKDILDELDMSNSEESLEEFLLTGNPEIEVDNISFWKLTNFIMEMLRNC